MTIAEAVAAAHADGRHVSKNADDRRFWAKVCPACHQEQTVRNIQRRVG